MPDTPAPDSLIGAEPAAPSDGGASSELEVGVIPSDATPDQAPIIASEPPAQAAETAADLLPATEPPAEPPTDKPKGGFPWSDLKKHQRAAEQLQQQLEAERAARSASDMRLAELERAFKGQQQPPEPWTPQSQRRPSQAEFEKLWEEDPILAGRVQSEWATRDAQMAMQQAQTNQQMMQIRAQEDAFRRTHADYDEALAFLNQRAQALWMAAKVPEAEAKLAVQAQAQAILRNALATGQDVADVFYAAAKEYGWAGSQPATPPPANGNGTPSPADAAARVRESQARSQLQNTSLDGVSGTPSTKTTYTRDEIMHLTEKQMDRLAAENPNWADLVEP